MSKYPDPTNQVCPWYSVVYKQDGAWAVHRTTYNKELAYSTRGALLNNNTFLNDGVDVIQTDDNLKALTYAIDVLNVRTLYE